MTGSFAGTSVVTELGSWQAPLSGPPGRLRDYDRGTDARGAECRGRPDAHGSVESRSQGRGRRFRVDHPWRVGARHDRRGTRLRVGGALAVGLVGFRFAPAAFAGLWTTQLTAHARHRPVLSLTAGARAAGHRDVCGRPGPGAPVRDRDRARVARRGGRIGLPTGAGRAAADARPVSGRIDGCHRTGVERQDLGTTDRRPDRWRARRSAPDLDPGRVAAALYTAAIFMTLGRRRPRLAGGTADRPQRPASGHSGPARQRRGAADRSLLLHALARPRSVVLARRCRLLQLLSLGRSGLGVLMAAAAVGALVAIIVTTRLVGNRRLAGWLTLGLILCGLPIAATGLAGGTVVAVGLMVVWGLGMALSDVGAQTLLNRLIPGSSIGPLTGVMEGGSSFPRASAAFSHRSCWRCSGPAAPCRGRGRASGGGRDRLPQHRQNRRPRGRAHRHPGVAARRAVLPAAARGRARGRRGTAAQRATSSRER